ncbi:MAG: hypothetical protein ABIN37_05355 [Burkholderiaceae bacterium]
MQVWREIGKLKETATAAGMTETQVSVAFNQVDLVIRDPGRSRAKPVIEQATA